MELTFENKDYDRLEIDAGYTHGLAAPLVALYRSRLQLLRSAHKERDLSAMQCLSFKALPAPSRGQHSIRLDGQYNLIVELQKRADGEVAQISVVRIDESGPRQMRRVSP